MQFWSRLTRFTRDVEERYPPVGSVMHLPHGQAHFLSAGECGGPPIILLHGASGNLRDFAISILPDLAQTRTVIAMDRPGFGHSDGLADAWRLRVQVNALRSVLHRLGHDRYILVGHSYAGALVLAWALIHPREVAGIGLISGAAMDWGGELELSYRIGGAPVIGPVMSQVVPVCVPRRWIDKALRNIFEPHQVPEAYQSAGGVELALRPATFRANFRAMNRLYDQIRLNEPQYGRIQCPAEIIHGTEDRIVPSDIHAIPLARALPSARLTMIEGAGHMPHHSHPEQATRALLRLVAG